MKRVLLAAAAVWLGGALRVFAQNPTQTPTPAPTPTPTPGAPTTVPAGVRFATEASANVNGVRVQVAPDGGVWFLESSADRVGVLRGTTITYWQLRPSDDLGANPVDFVLDGTDIWILESGQSQIAAGRCTIAKLDTATNQITEWTLPGSIPAAFYKAPDGTYWVPITGAALLNVNFETLRATNYRSASDLRVRRHGRRSRRDALARRLRQQPHRPVRARRGRPRLPGRSSILPMDGSTRLRSSSTTRAWSG